MEAIGRLKHWKNCFAMQRRRIFLFVEHISFLQKKKKGNVKLISEIKQVLSDVWAAFLYVLNGKPDDPKEYADDPPTFWHKATPVANVEKKRKSNVVELDLDTYTEQEIMEMTDAEFRIKVGATGLQDRESAIKELRKRNRGNAKEIQF